MPLNNAGPVSKMPGLRLFSNETWMAVRNSDMHWDRGELLFNAFKSAATTTEKD